MQKYQKIANKYTTKILFIALYCKKFTATSRFQFLLNKKEVKNVKIVIADIMVNVCEM